MTVRTSLSLAALGLLALAHLPALAAAPSLNTLGTWLTEDGLGRVRIEKCKPTGDAICGYVVWMKETLDDKGHLKLDSHNPDPKKKARAVLGHEMIVDFKPNDDERYAGKIYDADNGKSYDVTLWAEEPDKIRVKGVFFTYLCGSQAWTRVTDVAPGQLTGPAGGPKGPRIDPQ